MDREVSTVFRVRIVCCAVFISLSLILLNVKIVAADATGDALAEAEYGLSIAPNKLILNSDLFTVGDLSQYDDPSNTLTGKGKNLAQLQTVDGRPVSASNPYRAIRMTYNKGQTASIWSNMNGSNYFDLGKDQTLTMWLYFGRAKVKPGDGMAFVLQNDPKGTGAFSSLYNKIGAGETLGVWGVDTDYSVDSNITLAKSAIQNSWALEFDSNKNTNPAPGGADYFDANIATGSQHIADGEPGDSKMYRRYGTKPTFTWLRHLKDGGYYYSMAHGNASSAALTDGLWHHLTIKWDAAKKILHYSFNDKKMDGSKGDYPIEQNVPIDTSIFDTVNQNKLLWGFTATTGDYYQPNLVVFESIPAVVEGDVSSSIQDITKNEDVKANGIVDSADKLALNYKLTYQSGNKAWSNIQAKLVLPSLLNYPSTGTLGKITYSDGSVEDIPASSLTKDHTLNLTLKKSLSNTLNKATITINGTAPNVNVQTLVPEVRSVIDSPVLIKSVDTIPFYIAKSKPLLLSVDQNELTVNTNDSAKITGKVSNNDGSAVNNSQITIYPTLNGTNLAAFPLGSSGTDGKLTYQVPYAKLTQEKNTLTLYAKDTTGNISNSVSVIISKQGSLSLTVKDSSFKTVNQTFADRLIPRNGDWDIKVNDSRDAGQAWQLSATSTGLFCGTTKFLGNIIFRDSYSHENEFSTNSPVIIADGVKTGNNMQITNINDNWNSATGILLKATGQELAGLYSGKIVWTLVDSPK